MYKWVEDINDCLHDGKVKIKISFEIFSNFSFLRHASDLVLANGKSFIYDNSHQRKYKYSLNGIKLESEISLEEISLDENLYAEGAYDVEVILTYIVPKDLKENTNESRYSKKWSDVGEQIVDYFKGVVVLNGLSAQLVPSSLNIYILSNQGEWLRKSQIGGGHPAIYSCSPDSIREKITNLSGILSKTKFCLNDKKGSKLLKLLSSGIRLANNHLTEDAFLNFYKVVEMVFKSDEFIKKLLELTGKPSIYKNAITQCNQKLQMLFVWEYLHALDKTNNEALLQELLVLAEIRNQLAHGGSSDLDHRRLNLIRVIAHRLLEVFIEQSMERDANKSMQPTR